MKVLGTLTIVAFVVGLVTAIVLGLTSWHIDQDINGWKDRAQVSMEPTDMVTYLTNVKNGMQKWGMTSGNAALFFPTPETDMALIYKSVNQHITTAESLVAMDRSSIQYSAGLNNLGNRISELDLHAFQYWANHQGLLINIFCWIGWILSVVFGVWWLVASV
jgi:hypothetical protein